MNENIFENNENNLENIIKINENDETLKRKEQMPPPNNKKSKKEKIIIISSIVAVIIVTIVVVVVIYINNKSKEIVHENNTGLLEYDNTDVDLNCVNTEENNDATIETYSDLIFNYEDNYQVKVYSKKTFTYKVELSDEKYQQFIKDLNSINCLDETSCTSSHLSLGSTSLGWNTTIDRTDTQIIVTYTDTQGMGSKASKKDQDTIKLSYENSGYECK